MGLTTIQKVFAGVFAVVLLALVGSLVVVNIENASLKSKAKKAVKEKFEALEAKENYWQSVDQAYQDTMKLYHQERLLSKERSDSIRLARIEIQKLKLKQNEIVANWDDNDRLDELGRISTRHGIQ